MSRRALRNASQRIPRPSFWAQLLDKGSGEVETYLTTGQGVVTFTRASVAVTKLSSGLWASVASGTPRSFYSGMNTAVGTYSGYLSEGARTQLVTPTASIRDMTDAAWVKTNMTTAKTSTGIDGTANSCTRCTSTAGNATALQTLTAAASSRTYSCWIKRVTGTGNIELTQDGATFTNIATQINSTTFTMVQLNASQLNASFGIRIVTSGDAIDVDFNQFEAGAQASTPIPTAGLTRAADEMTYVFDGNASSSRGTCYAELSLLETAAPTYQVGVAFSASTAPFLINAADPATSIRMSDGTLSNVKTGLTDLTTGIRRRASSWGANESITGDGVAVTSLAFDGDIGSTSIAVGHTLAWYGTIKNLKIWKTQLPDKDLQALTA